MKHVFSFATMMLVLLFSSGARAGLIASWSGEGNANDVIGGINGSLVNGTTFDVGKVGQAFRFDGVNDYISIPDSSLWAFGSADFSIALWANFDVVKSQIHWQTPNTFLGHDNGPGNQNKWTFFFDDSPEGSNSGNLVFHINSPSQGPLFLFSPTTFSVSTGQWHHFAVTRSANTYTFFGDGVSLGSLVNTRFIPDAVAPLTIGQTEGLGYFDGRLDEIQIYNHALSQSEVAALANSSPAVPEPAGASLFGIGAVFLIMRRRLIRAAQFKGNRPTAVSTEFST